MNVPPWAGFVADFPDDQVEDGGDIEVFGGRNVAMALAEIFAGLGCSRVSDPQSVGEVGWEFDFKYGSRNRFSCRVQSFHPVFWLLFEEQSLSDGRAYVELWRKFGNALERDPRFHKILWRPSKEGPPHWDAVEAASDPPVRSFDEEFPPSRIQAKAIRPSIWPYIIGVWLTLSGIMLPLAKWEGADLLHKFGYLVSGIFFSSVGAFFLLIAVGQNWETLPWSSRRRRTSLPEPRVPEKNSPRPAKPRAKAAGGSLAPFVIGGWFALAMAAMALIDNTIHGAKTQGEVRTLAVAALLVGLVIVLRLIDRWRTRLQRPGEDRDSVP